MMSQHQKMDTYRFNEKRVLMRITSKIHTSINQSKDNSDDIGEKKIVER